MIVGWLRTLKERRDARTLERRPIPDDLWRLTLAQLPFLAVRPEQAAGPVETRTGAAVATATVRDGDVPAEPPRARAGGGTGFPPNAGGEGDGSAPA